MKASSGVSITSSRKRKRAVLSIKEKLKIIRKLDEGCSIVSISAEFGIGRVLFMALRHPEGKS